MSPSAHAPASVTLAPPTISLRDSRPHSSGSPQKILAASAGTTSSSTSPGTPRSRDPLSWTTATAPTPFASRSHRASPRGGSASPSSSSSATRRGSSSPPRDSSTAPSCAASPSYSGRTITRPFRRWRRATPRTSLAMPGRDDGRGSARTIATRMSMQRGGTSARSTSAGSPTPSAQQSQGATRGFSRASTTTLGHAGATELWYQDVEVDTRRCDVRNWSGRQCKALVPRARCGRRRRS
jgi:hypothetical protein